MKYIKYIGVFTLFIVHFGCNAEILEQYVENEQWQQAREHITLQQQKCYETNRQDKKSLEDCLLSTSFATAWLHSKQANLTQGNDLKETQRNHLLAQARDGYFAILKVRPLHNATTNNLIIILEQLADQPSLIKLLPLLKQANQVAESAEIIAQISLAKSDPNSAVTYLLKAFQINHSDGTLSRLLNAFSLKPTSRQANALLALAQKIRVNNLNHASQLYATIANHRRQVREKTWDQAVLEWVEIQGQLRQLTANLVRQTFNIEKEAVFRELYQRLSALYLGADEQHIKLNRRIMQTGRKNAGWWTQNEHRALALGVAGWSMGHNLLLQGQIKPAHDVWLGALYYAPNPTSYWGELRNKRAITLELLTDLARLQHTYKAQVDPNGENFKAIENLLFNSKAAAYEVNDLSAISRHHTLLGKLYADLGIFERGYRGAKFQLTNAIKTNKRLAEQNKTTALAQPQLAKLLAEGYSCKLVNQQKGCKKKPKQSSNWYQKATLGFLSLDALPQARKSLNSAKGLNVSSSPQLNEMEMILKVRQNITGEPASGLTQWLEQNNSSLPTSFVKQQKFKIFAEQGLQGDQKSAKHALSMSKMTNLNQSLIDQNRLLKLQQMKKK